MSNPMAVQSVPDSARVLRGGVGILLAGLCAVAPLVVTEAEGAGATNYPTIEKMVEELGEYSAESGTFKIISRRPLHIQIMPFGFLTDLPRIAESRVHMVAVETLYRAFIHTPVDKITLTVLPKTMPSGTQTSRVLTDLRVTITASRKQAHSLLNQYFPGKDFDDLVNRDVKSSLFDRMTFPDQGEPGVEKVFADLAQQGQ